MNELIELLNEAAQSLEDGTDYLNGQQHLIDADFELAARLRAKARELSEAK